MYSTQMVIYTTFGIMKILNKIMRNFSVYIIKKNGCKIKFDFMCLEIIYKYIDVYLSKNY